MLPTMRVYGFGFSIFLPCAPPSSAGWSGDFGEDCLSAWREFRSRLTSRATQGTAKRRQTGVAFFLVTFSLAKQEKVTSCRATPGGVDLPPIPNPLMKQLAIRLGHQKTMPKSLVIPRGERESVLILNGHFMMCPALSPHPSPTPSQT